MVVLIDHPYLAGKWQHRVDFSFSDSPDIIMSRGISPSAFITATIAPKFYIMDDNPFPQLQHLMSDRPQQAPKKVRVPALNEKHAKVAGTCFVYEVILNDQSTLLSLSDMLKSGPEMPSTSHMRIRSVKAMRSFEVQMESLRAALSHDWKGILPFSIRFQALRIACDGRLSPDSVAALIPELLYLLFEGTSAQICADAVCHLLDGMESPHPALSADDYSTESLTSRLRETVSQSVKMDSVYRAVRDHSHLALIHHIRITPSGIYLEGPTPEV